VTDRRLVAAAAAFILALVVAGGALVTLGVREPRLPATAVVEVPPPPPVAPEDAGDDVPGDGGDAPGATATSAQPPPLASPPSDEAVVAPEPVAPAGAAPDRATRAAAASPPERLVVIATGIAWNDDLAATAAFRLPSAVAFALPADLPAAVERLARWRAGGRGVALRFDWREPANVPGAAVPLAAGPGVQAGRMEQQWAELDVAAAVVVEPEAASALAPVAERLAASREAPVLLGSATPAAPPRAWRLDADLLGERALEDALARVVEGTVAGDTLVLLVEIYPALLDRFVQWLRELDDHGIALVPLDTLGEDRS
jgi:hypothetical protein